VSKPQRFNMVALNHGVHYYCTMKADADGAYILNSDYEELKARLAHVSEELFNIRMDVTKDEVLRNAFLETAKERLKKGQL
jgi:hypothetical protein